MQGSPQYSVKLSIGLNCAWFGQMLYLDRINGEYIKMFHLKQIIKYFWVFKVLFIRSWAVMAISPRLSAGWCQKCLLAVFAIQKSDPHSMQTPNSPRKNIHSIPAWKLLQILL